MERNKTVAEYARSSGKTAQTSGIKDKQHRREAARQIARESYEAKTRAISGTTLSSSRPKLDGRDVSAMKLLRPSKYENVDKLAAKRNIIGSTFLNCKRAGRSFAECDIEAREQRQKLRLENTTSIKEVIRRLAVRVLEDESVCSNDGGTGCEDETKEELESLGVETNEVDAMRFELAVSRAAEVYADSMSENLTPNECEANAKAEYEKLSFGFESRKEKNQATRRCAK